MDTKTQKILEQRLIDVNHLRHHIRQIKKYQGCKIWKIFLKTLSCVKQRHVDEVFYGIQEYVGLLSHSLANLPNSEFKLHGRYHYPLDIDFKIIHQINIDIKRLKNEYKNYNNIDLKNIYFNILLLISHRKIQIGYVQGMADFLVPFVMEFIKEEVKFNYFYFAESCSYYCYLSLVEKLEFNIINLQQNLILRFREEMENIDPILYAFLYDQELDFNIFCFRWFSCLFFREFEYDLYLRIFTIMLSYNDINRFLIFFGISLLTVLRNEIMQNDLHSNIIMLQELHKRKWRESDLDELFRRTDGFYIIDEKK